MRFFSTHVRPGIRLALGLAVLGFLAVPALAMIDDSRYSESEKAGFAFYKLARAKPNFENWIVKTEKYRTLLPQPRIDMLREETNRLHNGMVNFHPDEDFLHVMAEVDIGRYRGEALTEVGAGESILDIRLAGFQQIYFPFNVGDLWIAVIPEGIDLAGGVVMKKDDYRRLARKYGFDAGYVRSGKAILDMRLRAVSVDVSAPVRLDERDYWPMLAEIGSISLIDITSKDVIWSHRAPWFTTKEERAIMNLYETPH